MWLKFSPYVIKRVQRHFGPESQYVCVRTGALSFTEEAPGQVAHLFGEVIAWGLPSPL